MASSNIVSNLNRYFNDNWATSSVQFEGKVLSTKGLTKWISLTYSPVQNEALGSDQSVGCRVKYTGLWKVFCYAKNPTKTYQLMDEVKTFLNGQQINEIFVNVGQDNTVTKIDNTWYEGLCTFIVTEI